MDYIKIVWTVGIYRMNCLIFLHTCGYLAFDECKQKVLRFKSNKKYSTIKDLWLAYNNASFKK